jgi:hypothetical protein
MEYYLDYAGVETAVLRDCKLSKRPLPDWLNNKPKLIIGGEIYLQAFWDLDADRQTGFSRGRIPWTSVAAYSRFHNFNEEQTARLLSLIPKLDAAYLEKTKPKK